MSRVMTTLPDRLEEAEAGSRELDYAIKHWLETNTDDGYWKLRVAADWTTSLDAALAFAERLGLDGWNTLYSAMMSWKAHDPRRPLSATLPLALCAAILRAAPAMKGEG